MIYWKRFWSMSTKMNFIILNSLVSATVVNCYSNNFEDACIQECNKVMTVNKAVRKGKVWKFHAWNNFFFYCPINIHNNDPQ